MPRFFRRFATALTIFVSIGGCTTQQTTEVSQEPKPKTQITSLYSGTFPNAAVAADHPIASAAGAEILAKGGNAVDAAVATSFTLSVVRPMSCGIGGGGFMVIKFNNDPKHGNLATALNYRETTPVAVRPDFYENDPDKEASTVGGKAVAIPGTVRGLLVALEKYGTLDRATVLAPAIRAAEEGYLVDQFEFDGAKNRIKWFAADDSRKQRFAFVWKKFLREGQIKIGDRITNAEQAAALKLIARDGADAFYKGEIASAIGNAVRNDGGVLTLDDLANYRHREVKPLKQGTERISILTMPPPSSGGIVICQALRPTMIKIDSEIRLRGTWRTAIGKALFGDVPNLDGRSERIHSRVELWKHLFADRARWLADPDFAPVPTGYLVSERHFEKVAEKIRNARGTTRPSDEYGSEPPPPNDSGTSHLCVIDKHGNAVACTETINLSYGSKLAVPEFGFCLNNEMDDFTTRRGVANDFGLVQSERNMPQPGKRPLSSMSPTIVLDEKGEVFMIAGASGGPRIITGTAQAMLKVLIENASAAEAVSAPRIHHQWQPDVLEYEKGALSETNIEELKKRGHKVMPAKEDVGNVQLIRRSKDGKGWDAACDPRKGGKPAGN